MKHFSIKSVGMLLLLGGSALGTMSGCSSSDNGQDSSQTSQKSQPPVVPPQNKNTNNNCPQDPTELNYVTISSPQNGGEVGARGTATGTVSMKDSSSNVWVLVHRAILKDQWWPQPKPAVYENGTWESMVHFGEAGDINGKFEIAVATFSEEAEKEIKAFHKRGMATGNWSIPITFPKTTSNVCIVTIKKTSH